MHGGKGEEIPSKVYELDSFGSTGNRSGGEQEGCILNAGLSTSSLHTGWCITLCEIKRNCCKLFLLAHSISPTFLRLLSASYYKHLNPPGRKQKAGASNMVGY